MRTSTDEQDLLQSFLFERKRTAGTREQYLLAVRSFLDWCRAEAIDAFAATTSDIRAHRQSVLDSGRMLSTVDSRTYAIRAFYAYLLREQLVLNNPADGVAAQAARGIRDVLTITELAALWDASEGRDRVIIGLLGLCAVKLTELRNARIEDFHQRDGSTIMALPLRVGRHEFDYVAIPPQLADEIRAYAGNRRSGFLFEGYRGRDRISTGAVRSAIDRIAGRLDIPFRVTSLSLSFTLRALAIENRFSYVSVVRTVSEVEPRRLAEWANRVDLPITEHASMRLGRMVEAAVRGDGSTGAGEPVTVDELLSQRSLGLRTRCPCRRHATKPPIPVSKSRHRLHHPRRQVRRVDRPVRADRGARLTGHGPTPPQPGPTAARATP